MNHDQQYQQHLRLRYMEQESQLPTSVYLLEEYTPAWGSIVEGIFYSLEGAKSALVNELKRMMERHPDQKVEYTEEGKWQIFWSTYSIRKKDIQP